MKKIFTAVLCLGLAGTLMLGSCGKKEVKKEENLVVPEEIVEEVPEIVVPEEQLVFEFDVDSFDMEAKITAYIGEEKNVIVPETVIDPEYGDVLTVTEIGSMAFAKNETIEVVILPETIKTIGKGAFQSCPNLRAVSLPHGLETIEENAFYNSNKIEKLGMVIGNEPKAEEVEAPEAQEVAAEETAEVVLAEENAVEAVAVEETTEEAVVEEVVAEEIAEKANVDAFDMVSNVFPSTVTEIGLMAFSSQLNEIAWYSALEGNEVIIGDGILVKFNVEGDYTLSENVKKVAYYAFTKTGPAVITINNPEVEFSANAFFDCDKELKFLIPDGAEDLASSISAAGGKYEFLPPVVVEEEVAEGEETAEGEEVTAEETVAEETAE